MPRFLRPTALAILSLLWLHPAQAQDIYPCDFAGPGEVIIDMEPNGPGMPDTPICQYIGEGAGGGDPGGYWVDQYATLAWAQEANGTPTYSWYVNAASQAEADNGALAQCQSSGFRDCRVATWVVNGAIAVAVDSSGTLYSDHGEDARQAGKKALRACKQQGGKGCKVEQTLESLPVWVGN